MTDSTERFENVFVVIDPSRMIQPSLIKGERIAESNKTSLQLYCCVFDARYIDKAAEQKIEVDLTREWLKRLAAPARGKGLEVDIQVEWNADWREAIVDAANAAKSGLVVKAASHHSAVGRRLMKTSDWLLLKECACPVMLVSGHRLWEKRKLLAAVKLKPEDKVHEQLNENLIRVARAIASRADFELFAVTAYKGEEIFFDRQKFADACGLPRNHVFAEEGDPEDAIAKVAQNVGAEIIVIGNPGGSKRNTASLLIDQVDADVLVLPNVDS